MAGILLSSNKTTGVETYFHATDGEDSGNYVVETVQNDLNLITDYCHEVRLNNHNKGYGEGVVDYKIPAAMAGELMRKGLLFDQEYMAKWKRQHPEYSLISGQKYFAGATSSTPSLVTCYRLTPLER